MRLLHIVHYSHLAYSFFFFFNDTPTTEIYTLSLHDALPISSDTAIVMNSIGNPPAARTPSLARLASRSRVRLHGVASSWKDRKSTRLNSSHITISYAVFCLKKKKKKKINTK